MQRVCIVCSQMHRGVRDSDRGPFWLKAPVLSLPACLGSQPTRLLPTHHYPFIFNTWDYSRTACYDRGLPLQERRHWAYSWRSLAAVRAGPPLARRRLGAYARATGACTGATPSQQSKKKSSHAQRLHATCMVPPLGPPREDMRQH